nr:hypothetical protein [Tanacetum cinerariifolium]
MDYEFDFIVIAGRSSYRRSAPKTSKRTTPAPASSASSAPVKSEPGSGGFVANVVATVASGFIWAIGNAMAHKAMDAIIGPSTIQIENVPAAAPAAQVASSAADKCAGQNKAFND